MNSELSKAFVFLLVVTVLFWFAGMQGFYGHSSDNEAHQHMALDSSFNKDYAPLLRLLGFPFALNEDTWVFFIMLLFAFVTPLLLVVITKSWWAALFYFAITSNFYWTIQGGYAQGLLLIFVLGLFAFKDYRIRVPVFVVGLLSHSFAPLVLSVVFLLILLNENWGLIKKHFNSFKNAVLGGCSALLGKDAMDNNPLDQTLNVNTLSGNSVTYWGQVITPWSLFALIGKIYPILFAVPSFFELWKLKRFDLLALIVFGLFASLEYGTRSWYLLFIPLVIGFTWYWQGLESKNLKRFWLIMVLGYLIFQLYMWINFNLNC